MLRWKARDLHLPYFLLDSTASNGWGGTIDVCLLAWAGVDMHHWLGGAVHWIRGGNFMGEVICCVGKGLVVIKCLGWWLLTAEGAWDWYFVCVTAAVECAALYIWWCWSGGTVYCISSLNFCLCSTLWTRARFFALCGCDGCFHVMVVKILLSGSRFIYGSGDESCFCFLGDSRCHHRCPSRGSSCICVLQENAYLTERDIIGFALTHRNIEY